MNVFDLKNPRRQQIKKLGRVLPDAVDDPFAEIETFQCRGKCGLLLNPEGLWFFVSTTRYEAHTAEIYTPITPKNVDLIGNNLERMNQNIGVDFGTAKRFKQMSEKTLSKFPPRVV